MLHLFRRGHLAEWAKCCFDGMGFMWHCRACHPEWSLGHDRTEHGWWR